MRVCWERRAAAGGHPLHSAGGGLAIGTFLAALGVLSLLSTVFLGEIRFARLEPAPVA